mmetsp:Transcript_24467/g.45225  ORF Transcript_24467/g.45225 Transcript_24467/m.45225 type:complete len:210 (-) Transcript_24467:76-705(-)
MANKYEIIFTVDELPMYARPTPDIVWARAQTINTRPRIRWNLRYFWRTDGINCKKYRFHQRIAPTTCGKNTTNLVVKYDSALVLMKCTMTFGVSSSAIKAFNSSSLRLAFQKRSQMSRPSAIDHATRRRNACPYTATRVRLSHAFVSVFMGCFFTVMLALDRKVKCGLSCRWQTFSETSENCLVLWIAMARFARCIEFVRCVRYLKIVD